MLELANIHAGYHKDENILSGIDLAVNEGEVVGIIGQNGCGKSTLAKAILNHIPYKTGDVYFNNQSISEYPTYEIINAGIGYFPQGGRVFPNLTVHENLLFASRGLTKKQRLSRIEELKTFIPLLSGNKMVLNAGFLSGGEKNQLTLALVMLTQPHFLLLDEPSAGLSPANMDELYKILDHLKESHRLSMIVIEQNVQKVSAFADRLLKLQLKQLQENKPVEN